MVITGASSGIGLTTARAAAQRGARLVLAARNEDALKQLTEEICRENGEAVYVVADVGDESQVCQIAEVAEQSFGGFDTWINDAGVGIYGKMLDTPTADMHRLFATNFWGVVYGSLAAARAFRQQNRQMGGAIINVGSEVSDRAVPLIGLYSASKHAVKAFTDTLRMELEKAGDPVSVTLVKPGATDTPFPQHARNYLDQEPTLPKPVYAPEVVAEVILHCAETPERDMFAGASAKMHSLQGGLMPRVVDKFMEATFFRKQKSGNPPNHMDDALYTPSTGLQQRGNAQGHVRESSLYTQASMHPMMTLLALAGTGVALAAMFGQRNREHNGGCAVGSMGSPPPSSGSY